MADFVDQFLPFIFQFRPTSITIQDFSGPFSHATGQPDSLTRVVPNSSSSNRHRNMVRLSRTAEGWHKWSTWDVTRMSLVMSGKSQWWQPNGLNILKWDPAISSHGCSWLLTRRSPTENDERRGPAAVQLSARAAGTTSTGDFNMKWS
jgi:hypothetical protein